MKNLILIISILLAVSCGKGKEAPSKTNVTGGNNTKPIKVDDNATKPVKELTLEEKVVGEYELIISPQNAGRFVFLENGIVEAYLNGNKDEEEGKWKLTKEGELHATRHDGTILVYRINKDGGITIIARIDADGKREEAPKDKQMTLKKIK